MENNQPWHTGPPPPSLEEEIEVMMVDSGKVRRAQRQPVDYGNFFFTDCTHPAQNAYCWLGNVKAWRHL